MTCAVEHPFVSDNATISIPLEVVDIDVDTATEVEPQISDPIHVFEIDLTLYYQGPSLLQQETHLLSPLERFMSYRCSREALFANVDSVLPESYSQHRGRSRAGKRKGRRSSVRAQSGSVRGTLARNCS